MRARTWWWLSAWMALGAVVCWALPKHAWFNTPGGEYVLGTIALSSALAGAWVKLHERRAAAKE